jgi:hypothetical protein
VGFGADGTRWRQGFEDDACGGDRWVGGAELGIAWFESVDMVGEWCVRSVYCSVMAFQIQGCCGNSTPRPLLQPNPQ